MRIPAGQRQNNNISYTRWTELTHYSLHASFLKRPTRSRVFHWLNVEYDVNISVLVVGAYIHAFLPAHACSSFTPRFVDNVLIPQTIRKVTRNSARGYHRYLKANTISRFPLRRAIHEQAIKKETNAWHSRPEITLWYYSIHVLRKQSIYILTLGVPPPRIFTL